ncbi:MAG: VCBS repeat-containing protein, partial [Ignavibacteria bacterium]|nr:VCBS repeat-containing protein [Ignavibacteria bacterium]
MKRLSYFFIFVALLFSSQIFAQDIFTRTTVVQTDLLEPNGFGNMIVGVDFDNDGKTEVYLCNTNTLDDPGALIPRLYKFELNGTTWQQVWMTEAPIPKQNTWPAMTWGDMDKDGRPEIYWGPVNWIEAGNENPPRVLVYEYPGDGTD